MARRPSGEGDDKSGERGGLFDEGGHYGDTLEPEPDTDTDNWYKPAGVVIGRAPTGPAPGSSPAGSRIGAAPQRPPSAEPPTRKIAESDSTRIAASPFLPPPPAPPRPGAAPKPPAPVVPPLAGDATRVLTFEDTPAPFVSPDLVIHKLSREEARALLPEIAKPPPRPSQQIAPVQAPRPSQQIAAAPPLQAPMPSKPLADATRMLELGSDSTRISMGMPTLTGGALPAGHITAKTAGPPFGASKEARSKIIARGAGGAHEESTRIVQVGQVAELLGQAAPAWRAAAVARTQTAPDTLAWEKEEGTVARLVSTFKVIAGGKGDKAAKPKAPSVVTGDTLFKLRVLPFLAGIDDFTLDAAHKSGALALGEHGRDYLFDAEGGAVLIVEGQIALGRFAKDKMEVEKKAQAALDPKDKKAAKKEAKRRMEAGPLIRVAEANVAFFEKGDLVHVRDQPPPPGLALGVYSTTPVTAVSIRNDLLEQWKRAYPFFADRVRRASSAANGRITAVGGARSEVADFFIRHGLSVSLVLRVRAIDMCIECGACEQACEDRYGAKRLSLGGRKLGTLDFVDACHTCTDQRCIDPCAFDAIKFDAEKKEVVIIEGACTGCTLCATACPYAAIEMHDFEDKPLLQIRLDKQGKLGFGESAPPIQTQFGPIKARKSKAKRIASKCDHCIDYEDQACISACPTGALVDVEPGDVFAARSAVIAEQADDGYDHSRILDVATLNDPRLFQQGLSSRTVQKLDKGRAIKKQIGTTWMWVVGIGAWLIAFAEIVLRKVAPTHSIDFLYMTLAEGMEKELALDRVDFHAGSTYALRLGYIGSALMYSSLLYPLRRRVPLFKNAGSQRGWFDIHVLTGVIGPLFVALHSALKLDTWVASAIYAMCATAISGALGRYVFTQIPEWASAASLHASDSVGKLDELRAVHPGVRALDNWFLAYQKRVGAVAELSGLRVLAWMFAEWLRSLPLRLDLMQRVAGVVDAKARKESVRAALLLAKYERHKMLLPKLEPLARRWKVVHVPAAILLTVLGGIHIVISFFT